MENELNSFEENSAQEVQDLPENAALVDNKWVFKRKVKTEDRYRARILAKGFTQKYGLDYQETFSPVLRFSTFRLLVTLFVQLV